VVWELKKKLPWADIGGAATLTIKGRYRISHDSILNLVDNAPGIFFYIELY